MPHSAGVPASVSNVLREVNELAQDRVHGASALGCRAIEIMADAVKASDAESIDALFAHLLIVATKLRGAQLGMATIRNLVGRFLYHAESKRKEFTSLDDFRRSLILAADGILAQVRQSVECVARNASGILTPHGTILTHSYSSTVLRTLEIAIGAGSPPRVYVTESIPGSEGITLARDLAQLGLDATIVPDSEIARYISQVDAILVGADSVLKDGSIINKVGTKQIAELARRVHVPFHVACETAKFSIADFLGEVVSFDSELFDVTPGELIWMIITENGVMKPHEVERQMEDMLGELYL